MNLNSSGNALSGQFTFLPEGQKDRYCEQEEVRESEFDMKEKTNAFSHKSYHVKKYFLNLARKKRLCLNVCLKGQEEVQITVYYE